MKTKPRTPDQVSAAVLRQLAKKYATPKNSMEAFILYGVKEAMRKRDIEHPAIPTSSSTDDWVDEDHAISHDAVIEQFEAHIHGIRPVAQ
jgi:hypothetical protein